MSDPTGFTEASLQNNVEISNLNSSPESFAQDWNYEATVKKIEEITTRIEAGELELAEVFDQFATAVEYLQQCETFLGQRQQQMDLLIETLTDEPEF
ncbi:MAG: exodeoxyribonuclease VII small subunit [Kovacikia sp.]